MAQPVRPRSKGMAPRDRINPKTLRAFPVVTGVIFIIFLFVFCAFVHRQRDGKIVFAALVLALPVRRLNLLHPDGHSADFNPGQAARLRFTVSQATPLRTISAPTTGAMTRLSVVSK